MFNRLRHYLPRRRQWLGTLPFPAFVVLVDLTSNEASLGITVLLAIMAFAVSVLFITIRNRQAVRARHREQRSLMSLPLVTGVATNLVTSDLNYSRLVVEAADGADINTVAATVQAAGWPILPPRESEAAFVVNLGYTPSLEEAETIMAQLRQLDGVGWVGPDGWVQTC